MNDKNKPGLTPRTAAIASLARPFKKIADIGTDHAYIPVYLIQEGIAPFAVASDIRKGPLDKAGETIEKFGVRDKVQTVLCDGLSGIDGSLVDDIIIAGMGGEQIAKILQAAPWVHSGDRRLILQPMTAIPKLRKYLFENNFIIETEKIAKEGRKLYVIMVVKSGKPQNPQIIDLIFGPKLKQNKGELETEYLKSLIFKYKKTYNDIKKAVSDRDNHKLLEIEEILTALNNQKEV